MSDYTITKIGTQPPRSWNFKDRNTGNNIPMETYKVMLEGIEEPVDLNRKPGNAPKVGDVISGSLEPSDFGQRFKADKKPFVPGVKDNKEIKAMWAIGQAINYLIPSKDLGFGDIEPMAQEFFEMVSRVKGDSSPLDKVVPVIDGEPITIPDVFK